MSRPSSFETLALLLALVVVDLSARAPAASAADETGPVFGPTEMPTGPSEPEAKLKYEEGLALFAKKQYAAAIAAFDAGFAREPHRAFLFAKGQAQRLAGDCSHAIATYDAFLATTPPPLQVDATHLAIERCARSAALTPPPAAAATVPPPSNISSPSLAPAWRRPPALVLWAAAGLAFGTGTWLYLSSRSARDDAARAQDREDYDAYAAAWRRGNARLRGADVAWLAGLLLTAGGVTYVEASRSWAKGHDKSRDNGLAVWLAPSSGGVAWHGRF